MQVSVEKTQGLERRLTVEVPTANIEQTVAERLKSMAGRVRIAGFRPGKVPLKLVQSRYGDQVRAEVQEDLMRTSFYEAVQRENLRPAGTPSIELQASGADTLKFTATFEVYPDVTVDVPATLSVEKPIVTITESDVDAMVDRLRRQRASWVTVERAAADGDRITIDFRGSIDGVAFTGGEANNYPLVLGSRRLIPGFEEQVVGMKAGEQRDITVSFPAEYPNQALAGKTAVFAITAHAVAEQRLPGVADPDFLALLGAETVEDMRRDVRASMQRELDQAIRNRIKSQLLDKLVEANPIEVPKALVENEIAQMANQARQNMGMTGNQPVTDELRAAFDATARRRVAIGLLIGEVIRSQGIKNDPARVRARIETLAASYEQPQEVLDWYYQDRNRLAGVEALVLEDQAVEWVLGQVKTEDKPMGFDAIMQPGAEAAA